MNSAEEISRYNDHNSHYCTPVLSRRLAGTNYDVPEKSQKKDKKWSIGNFFRRKKKESESSSDDENQSKQFLQKKKKKSDKRKRTNKTLGFDHVVISPTSRSTIPNGYKNYEDTMGVLSEPTASGRIMSKNFISASDYTSRMTHLKDSDDCIERNRLNNKLGSPSVNSLGRRKKETVKARAEARRDTSKGEESSDDDSQRSAFRSDESLTRHKDASLNRRSRAARTQRYLRRRSKDDEFRDHLKTSKPDMDSDYSKNFKMPDERLENVKTAIKSPILSTTSKSKLCYTNSAPSSRPNFSGLSTIPPSHGNHNKYRAVSLMNGSSYKQSPSFNDYIDSGNKCMPTDLNNQRSLSCDSNYFSNETASENINEIVHAQLPIGKLYSKGPNLIINQNVNILRKQPPPPPPRDPRRILAAQNSDARPLSYSFENGYNATKITCDQLLNQEYFETNDNNNFNSNRRSTSEDHISWEPTQRIPSIPRASSATPETNSIQKLSRLYSETGNNVNNYRYLTDKNPRSRKPISIKQSNPQNEPLSPNRSQKPFDFWRQKDEENSRINNRKSTSNSPMMFTAQAHVRTNIFLPNSEPTVNDSDTIKREASPFRPISPTKPLSPKLEESVDDSNKVERKSSNLEDALDELEAIYNSLHLGDEDLLDRAEQREAAASQKRRDAAFESFPAPMSRNNLNDSTFGFDPNFDSFRKKRTIKMSESDRKTDDMAFRKLNKERSNTISDPQSVVSKVSYLLTSPIFNTPVDESVSPSCNNKNKEPDVTFDDVVYRNVKHTNNTLKVTEPQLPFGIPVGPVLPAANSDYLHATPEVSQRFSFKPKKIPDVVKDDLAYRNLRKDPNKEPSLPPCNLSPEDYINNNNNKAGDTFKRKRAVRSLSANIFNLVHKDPNVNFVPSNNNNNHEPKQNITDVADALEVARQILRDKENKINATRQAFMSDGELKYRKFGNNSPIENRKYSLGDTKEGILHHKLQVNIPIINYDRLEGKPPTPDRRGSKASTKESTPIPSSPSDDALLKKQLQESTLDELLTSLAVEARKTSERITNELKCLGEENECKTSLKNEDLIDESEHQSNIETVWSFPKVESDFHFNPTYINGDVDQSKIDNKDQKTHLHSLEIDLTTFEQDPIISTLNNLQLQEIDSKSEHAKLCEKLLECVVENTELIAVAKEEQEPLEEVVKIRIDPLPEFVANIVSIPSDKSKLEIDPVSLEVYSESDHDYVNIQSNEEIEKDEETSGDAPNILAAFGSSTEMDEEEKELLLINDDNFNADVCTGQVDTHKLELGSALEEFDLADENLKKRNSDRVDSDSFKSIDQTDKGGGEECFCVEYIALPTKESAFVNEPCFNLNDTDPEASETYVNVYNFDFDRKGEPYEYEQQNYVSEFYFNDNCAEGSKCKTEFVLGETDAKDTYPISRYCNEEALESLKSPKLVKNLNDSYKTLCSNKKLLDDSGSRLNGLDLSDECSAERGSDCSQKSDASGNTKNACDKLVLESQSNRNSLGSRDSRHALEDLETSSSWYEDPTTIAIACSFGIACTSQLPSFDVIAALGLLLAVISFIIAVIART